MSKIFPVQPMKKKKIASSELILQLLIRQTDFGGDPSGLRRRSGGKSHVKAHIFSLSCSERLKNTTVMFA